MTHKFKESLARVVGDTPERARLNTILELNGYTFTWYDDDMAKQAAGVDLEFSKNGHTYKADWKLRHKNYLDFLAEIDSHSAHGWLDKSTAQITHIIYQLPDHIYLIDWHKLRARYLKRRAHWLLCYPEIEVENEGYFSRNICVPWSEIRRCWSKLV